VCFRTITVDVNHIRTLDFILNIGHRPDAVIHDPQVQEKLFSYLPKKGFVAIGWTENEIRDFTNTKRPIRKPEDMKGLKVRVMEAPVYMDTFKQLGASPVWIPFPKNKASKA
jgi:TRAP-type C4-dicarboxylate transport system substrate-binding protein